MIDQDLFYNNLNSTAIQSTLLVSDQFDAGVKISGNVIETPSADLIVNADGTGKVVTDSVLVDQDLTVNGIINLKSTTVGPTNVTGSISLTGNSQQTGNLSISNNLNVNYLELDDIAIQGNVITTTLANNDLLLQAAGTGKVIFQENVLADINVTVQNAAFSNLASIEYQASSSQLILDGVTVTGNVVESNNLNENLVLDPVGSLLIPTTNLIVDGDLDILGTTDLLNLDITGNINHVGLFIFL